MNWTSTTTTANANTAIRVTIGNYRINYGSDDHAAGGVPRSPEPPIDPYPDAIEAEFQIVAPNERDPIAAIGAPV